MSSWMQYEATKLAYAEQQFRDRHAIYDVTKRPGLARRMASWLGARLGRQRPAVSEHGALSAQELREAPRAYRLN